MPNDEEKWIKFRIATALMFFLLLFAILIARAVQLSFLSPGLVEISNIQRDKAFETKALIRELQQNINKLKALSPSYDILGENAQYSDNVLLSMERGKLLKEINGLRSQHQMLSKEVQSLQDSLSSLSKIEERGMQQIIDAYDRIHRSEKWFNFIVNFLMGVITSLVGSIIYKLVATKYNLPLIDIFNQIMKKKLHLRIKPKT
jgi:cell division protein FtsB